MVVNNVKVIKNHVYFPTNFNLRMDLIIHSFYDVNRNVLFSTVKYSPLAQIYTNRKKKITTQFNLYVDAL